MQCRLQPAKKILQMPLVPLMEGSSPLWIHIDAIFKPASIPQYPASPLNLLTRHSLGHNVQFSSINLSLLSYISACFTVTLINVVLLTGSLKSIANIEMFADFQATSLNHKHNTSILMLIFLVI